jgi:hypothetical protein
METVRVRHEGGRQRAPVYCRGQCAACGRYGWQQRRGFYRTENGRWREQLRCRWCGSEWSRAALPIEAQRMEAQRGRTPRVRQLALAGVGDQGLGIGH